MVHTNATERRQHRRYLVEGKAVVRTARGQFVADLVDVGGGGILLLAPGDTVKVGEPVQVRFSMEGYTVEVNVQGRVARTDTHAIGIAFSELPVELEEAVLWLEAGFLATLF